MANGVVKTGLIISTVIGLILVATLLPVGLTALVAYNGTYTNASNSSQVLGINSTIGTLVGTVIPIVGVIALALMFIYKRD